VEPGYVPGERSSRRRRTEGPLVDPVNPVRTRIFTPARVIALAVTGLVVLGLVALRIDRGPELPAVTDGASAGDLVLEPCTFTAAGDTYPADCGTLVMAEDPRDAGSRLITLPLIRVRAVTDEPQEPVFFLTGGPGQSNIEFASEFADRYVADRDFVVVGYRGADGSVRLDCPEVSRALSRSTDVLGDAFFTAVAHAYGSCASRFAGEGIDVTRYGLVQQVDDMEGARAALGYDRINLLSESAGTRTALIYAWRHPESIHRSLMVGVNPPGAFLWDPDITDEQLGRYAALCAADDACRARTDDLTATVRRTTADFPDRWLFLPIKESNLRAMTLFGMFDTVPTGAAYAPMMIDAWLAAAEGDAGGFWFTSILVDVMSADLFIAGQRAAAASLDHRAAREYFADGPGDLANLGRAATASAWAAGRWVDVWPTAAEVGAYQLMRSSAVETLVVNGVLDLSTPPQLAARDLMPYLPNGQEVVLADFGHTESFFRQQPDAGTHLVNTFFDSGRVDLSRYQPQPVDFTPPTTYGAYARMVLAALLGLAALTVLSLVALAHRVRTRGHVGPSAAAAVRSVFLLVLGLGGWSLGALLVLTAMPGARITGELVVVTSVAVPIGLGAYVAWVQRGWSAPLRYAGSVAVAAGALGGAWLGFHAAAVPFALFTAIAGAGAGANLTLILLDMWRAESTERRGAARPMDAYTPEPATSTVAGGS
jgi:pimeloyl-ACP methyl ester carboxylesterase